MQDFDFEIEEFDTNTSVCAARAAPQAPLMKRHQLGLGLSPRLFISKELYSAIPASY